MTADPHEAAERQRLGKALRALRMKSGITQDAAAGRAGVTLQAWQNYEAGKRIWKPQLFDRVQRALGASEEDLRLEMARQHPARDAAPGGSVRETSRQLSLPVDGIVHAGALRQGAYDPSGEQEVIDFSSFFGPEWRVLRLAGDSMVPYAEPGGFVTYSKRRPPRRGQGCVIVTREGEYLVKRFERMTDEKLIVTQLHPAEQTLELDMASIEGVYAIGLRGD